MSHLDEERLTALLDNELPALEARKAREHLAECAECSARFEEIKGFFTEADRLVQVLAFPQAPPTEEPVQAPAPAVKSRRPLPLKQLAWAASIVLAVGFGYYGNQVVKQREAPELDERGAVQAIREPSDAGADRNPGQSAPSETPPAAPPGAPTGASAGASAGAPSSAANEKAEAQTSKDELKKEARPQPAVPQRAPVNAPATASSGAVGNLAGARLKEAVSQKQAPTAQADDKARNGAAAAPAEQPVKRSDSALADAESVLRRERSAAEARSFSAKTDALQSTAAAPPAPAAYRTVPIPPPVKVTMEQAIQALGGTIHLIDGMSPDRVERLTARAVPGAHAGLPVIRIIYVDPPMREIWLDQQRGLGTSAPRDTILQWTPDGGQNMQWMTGSDDWLSLTAHLTADSVRTLAQWVR